VCDADNNVITCKIGYCDGSLSKLCRKVERDVCARVRKALI